MSSEASLEECYREVAGYYATALSCAETLPTEISRGARIDGCVEQLQRLFQSVALVEARLRPLEATANPSECVAGSGWEGAKAEVLVLLEKLIQCIRRAEGEAIAQRDSLILPVEMGIRVRRMQQAYGQGV